MTVPTRNITMPSWLQQEYVKSIYSALEVPGHTVRFVGGCVRDALIGKQATDIDIATSLVPEHIIRQLEQHYIKPIPTGIKHGTITALCKGKTIEITTLRKDVRCDGRHADVEFTSSWKEDAARRDFTINALSCNKEGEVFDYFDGISDLEQGKVKFVGNPEERIIEDSLRVLRFFRFSAYYAKGKMDPTMLAACEAQKERIEALAGERIQKEMFKLLEAQNPEPVIRAMIKTNIIQTIALNPANTKTLERLIVQPCLDPIIRLASLIEPNETSIDRLVKRWKLSNKHKEILRILLLSPPPSSTMDQAAIRSYTRKHGKDITQAKLAFTQALEEHTDPKAWQSVKQEIAEWKIPTFPLTGNDIKAIGLPQGKALGEQLTKAEIWWEKNHYSPTKEGIIEWLKANLKSK